jgi:hypothetical protein
LASFIGGLRLRPVFANWGWPGAKLTICDEGVRIGPSFIIFRFFVPVRAFRYDDLLEAQAVGTLIFGQGIRFTSRTTDRWAIFWSGSRQDILALLGSLTEVVNAQPIRLNYWNPSPRQ